MKTNQFTDRIKKMVTVADDSTVCLYHHGSYNYNLNHQNSDYDIVKIITPQPNNGKRPMLNCQKDKQSNGEEILTMTTYGFDERLNNGYLDYFSAFFGDRLTNHYNLPYFSQRIGGMYLTANLDEVAIYFEKRADNYIQKMFKPNQNPNDQYSRYGYRVKDIQHLYRLTVLIKQLVKTIKTVQTTTDLYDWLQQSQSFNPFLMTDPVEIQTFRSFADDNRYKSDDLHELTAIYRQMIQQSSDELKQLFHQYDFTTFESKIAAIQLSVKPFKFDNQCCFIAADGTMINDVKIP